MTPDTAYLLEQQLRHFRSLLTSHMKWNQRQPHSSTRIENFEMVAFWREILNLAERRIGSLPVHHVNGRSASESQVTG